MIADGPIAAAALAHLARKRQVIYNAHNLESGFRHELDRRGAARQRALRASSAGLLGRVQPSRGW